MVRDDAASAIERVVVGGDLAKLTPEQRVAYYRQVCDSLGLNPYTQPFSYIVLNGKLTLYATRGASDQLRKLHRVSVTIVGREQVDDLYVVTARATMPEGRTDESIGAVALGSLKGDARANAIMKAETKAKRRVTLSIVGLGWLDETEIETIPNAGHVQVDAGTGEILTPSLPSPGPQGGESDRRPAWSRDEQRRFTAAVVEGMGLGMGDLKRLLPELADGARLSDLGTLDEVVALVKERLAAAMSDGADGEAA